MAVKGNPSPALGFVYGLTDPNSGEVRYIGKSIRPNRRHREHMEPCSLRSVTRKNGWLKSILKTGDEPGMVILSQVPVTLLDEEEMRIIGLFRDLGFDLVNGTNGGDGGAVTDPDARRRISEAHRGKTLSPEHRRLIGESNRGKKMSPEARQRQSVAQQRRCDEGRSARGEGIASSVLTENDVREIRRLYEVGNLTNTEIAAQFGVTKTNVGYIVKRKSWKHVE